MYRFISLCYWGDQWDQESLCSSVMLLQIIIVVFSLKCLKCLKMFRKLISLYSFVLDVTVNKLSLINTSSILCIFNSVHVFF